MSKIKNIKILGPPWRLRGLCSPNNNEPILNLNKFWSNISVFRISNYTHFCIFEIPIFENIFSENPLLFIVNPAH